MDQIGDMTPRECFGLLEKLNIEKLHETGKQISLAGGDGQAYIEEKASTIEVENQNSDEDFEAYRDSLSEALYGKLH